MLPALQCGQAEIPEERSQNTRHRVVASEDDTPKPDEPMRGRPESLRGATATMGWWRRMIHAATDESEMQNFGCWQSFISARGTLQEGVCFTGSRGHRKAALRDLSAP